MIKTFVLLLVAVLPLFLLSSCSDDDDEVVSTQSGTIGKYDYVDLGLSVKWATCNVGASSPSDYGDYFAWGEIKTKNSYSISNSTTYGKSMEDISGSYSYDTARAQWGYPWRMPTKSEMEELIEKCTWKYTTQGGNNGCTVTGPSGGSIFLPAAGTNAWSTHNGNGGSGWYWASTPDQDGSNINSYQLTFSGVDIWIDSWMRFFGLSIRPVTD